jgi:hypothetical protein
MRQARKTLLLTLAATLPLFGASGCLSLLSASASTAEKAKRLARFDSECPSMRIVARLNSSRYRLRGCGQEMLYSCGKSTRSTGIGDGPRPRSKAGAVIGLAALLLVGPTVTNTHCQLVATRPVPTPSARDRWPRSHERPTAVGDEPGVSVSATKTAGAHAKSKPHAPTAARPDPRDVRAAMVRIRPRLLVCAAQRRLADAVIVAVNLRVSPDGSVTDARVDTQSLAPSTRRCLARAFRALRLPAAKVAPRWLRYRVRVR